MHLLVVIVEDMHIVPALLRRWREVGVEGTTILQSVGGYRASSWLEKVGLTMLGRGFEAEDIKQRMVISLIEEDEVLERAIAEAERLAGGFEHPHSGILFVLPVHRALGLKKRQPPHIGESAVSEADLGEKGSIRASGMSVAEILTARPFHPVTVGPDVSLLDIACALLEKPFCQVVCVVNTEGRLAGLIRQETVAKDLFVRLMPEEILHDMSALNEALDYAKALKHRTAGDMMDPPVFVYPADSVRRALQLMHDHQLAGLPVVDATNHVIGYVRFLDLLVWIGDHYGVLGCHDGTSGATS